MLKTFITNNFKETQKLGELLALEIEDDRKGSALAELMQSQRLNLGGARVFCLDGELGAGKTTFTQGLLKGLGAKGPYTSPTFLIMKEYEIKDTNHKIRITNKSQDTNHKIQKVYHIDAYRINAQDLLNLGWEEIIADPKNVVIVEWSERIEKILPKEAIMIKFEWLDENQRRITLEA